MTAAEELRREGRQEGRQEGLHKGRHEGYSQAQQVIAQRMLGAGLSKELVEEIINAKDSESVNS